MGKIERTIISDRRSSRNNNRTGMIWFKPPRVRAQIVRRVCETLGKTYGKPRLGNPEDPVDDLVYVILSNRTLPEMAIRTYKCTKQKFKTWDNVIASHPSLLRSLLKPAGLSMVKSKQIREALQKIKKDFGSCDLNNLRGKSKDEIQEYLVSLPGVSEKVAKCVMMYTLGADVLPVDTHVHRVAKRLGWTARKRLDQCHEELESLVPTRWRYVFHVACIEHGRSVCRSKNPYCEKCPINHYCEYFKGMK